MMFHTVVLSLFVAFGLAEDRRLIFDPFLVGGSSAPRLEQYNVDKSQISVSGISSGAAMATQIHVIYSSHIMGVGMVAGIPFACTEDEGVVAAEMCMKTPSLVDVTALEDITDAGALDLNIDGTLHMRNDNVYIFDGKADKIVNPDIGPVIQSYYAHYVAHPRQQIKTVFNINAAHGQPTNNYGGPCSTQSTTDFLNNCNYSAAYDLLNFIYGGHLTKPSPEAKQTGQLLKFDQEEFFDIIPPSMDDIGYVYVPQGCASKTHECKLHVAFHGCEMGQEYIGDHYVVHGGYNEVADLNSIIILYPQAIKSVVDNPEGCWDWWGYTGELFATNKGFQPIAIKGMIDKVTG